jgi:hypothetical protein
MELTFSSSKEHILNKLEYEALWTSYGKKIKEAFNKVVGLPFKEEIVKAIVGDYESNFAGKSIHDPMLFRYSVRHKLGTILHELSHRLLLEYSFEYDGIVSNDHELIDLFLYDVIEESFGKSAADERMNYELTFLEVEIVSSWKKIMCNSFVERQRLLKKIIDNQNKPK